MKTWAPPATQDRVLAVPAEPAAQSHRFALRPTGAADPEYLAWLDRRGETNPLILEELL